MDVIHNNKKFTPDEFIAFMLEMKDFTFNDSKSVFSSIPGMLKLLEIENESTILDYGSGLGQVSAFIFEKYGCKIDAVEPYKDWRDKANFVWRTNLGYGINFIDLDSYTFPENRYDLVISTQVIEHVHNPGMYLSNILKMLKHNGVLLIGLPNGSNLRTLFTQLRYGKKTVLQRSIKVLSEYDKPNYHIHCWDSYHFTTLLSSCGFKVIDFAHNGGIPLPIANIPLVGKYLPSYIYINVPLFNRLSYGMTFLARKSNSVDIKPFD